MARRDSSDTEQPLLFAIDPDIERDARRRWKGLVAGVDEAGRGPLAGPVVAAAVILDPDRVPEGVNDSKQLTPEVREDLFAALTGGDHVVAVAFASAERIDRDNIRQATLWAMARAVACLDTRPAGILVDGIDVPPRAPCPGMAVVDGDARVASIAAASIVAKVLRDRMMRRYGAEFPGYGFENHFGYATPEHRRALVKLGPTPLHRRSFEPVRLAEARVKRRAYRAKAAERAAAPLQLALAAE